MMHYPISAKYLSTALLLLTTVLPLTAGTRTTIVKVYDYKGSVEEVAMDREEMQALHQEIMQEARFHMPALIEAEKAWKERGEKGNFPKTAVKRRRFIKTNTFNSRADAEDYLDRRRESKEEFDEKKLEREKKSSKNSKHNKSSSKSKDRQSKKEASAKKRMEKKEQAVEYYLEAMDMVKQKEAERLEKQKSKTPGQF